MYALDNKSGIKQMPEIPEVFSKEPLWFTEGRDGNAPSYPGAHWFNIIQAELLNVLKEAGIEPDKTDLTQLSKALQVLSGQVESISALREFEPRRDRQLAYVKGYHAGSTKGGGYFMADLSDNASADNSGTVIVTAGGKRWKRIDNILLPDDFGASQSQDNVAFTHGITRIYGANSLALDYKKETDQFNVPESVVAIGRGALNSAIGAGQTIAIGGNALNQATQSYSNIAIGETALEKLQSSGSSYYQAANGSRNIAIGGNALQFLKDGTRNVAIGRNTACGLQSAWDCTAIGSGALSGENTNGWYKDVEVQVGNSQKEAKITTVGHNSLLYFNGKFATALGGQAGLHLKTGDANTLLGYRTGMNLEHDVGWDGFVKTIYGQGDKGLQVPYTKQGNQVTVTIANHRCVVGATAYIKWDSGPAFPQPAHWHAWRQKVVAVTNNTVTFECPYEGDGNGIATIYWSLSQDKDPNTSRHNTFVGHTSGWHAKHANNNVVVGSLASALAESINNAVVIGFSAAVKATSINNSVIIGSNAASQLTDINNRLYIADVITGDLLSGRVGLHMPLTQAPLADLHLRAKGDSGSGRTTTTNGLLVESSATASIHLDGRNAGNLDFEQGGVFRGGLRYSYSGKFMTVVMGGASSWRFDEDNNFYPVNEGKGTLGLPNKKLKEIHVVTPELDDKSSKTPSTEWVKNLLENNIARNGWQKLPNGLIMQWGVIENIPNRDGATGEVNLPIYADILNITVGVASSTNQDAVLYVHPIEKGKFSYVKGWTNNGSNTGVYFFWQALTRP